MFVLSKLVVPIVGPRQYNLSSSSSLSPADYLPFRAWTLLGFVPPRLRRLGGSTSFGGVFWWGAQVCSIFLSVLRVHGDVGFFFSRPDIYTINPAGAEGLKIRQADENLKNIGKV
jgi:hypothetical protein